jgi:hypothetical protein
LAINNGFRAHKPGFHRARRLPAPIQPNKEIFCCQRNGFSIKEPSTAAFSTQAER